MNEFTKGRWVAITEPVSGGHSVKVDAPKSRPLCCAWQRDNETLNQGISWGESLANAKLIAASGASANKLAEMGYDAQKVIEMLPGIMETVINCEEYWNRDNNQEAMSNALWHIIGGLGLIIEEARGEQP